MFGRGSEHVADVEEIPSIEPRRPVAARLANNRRGGAGPFDVDDPDGFDIEGGLDFGSLRVPMPARAQLQVEHGSGELLRAVHVLVPAGRVSLSALAAPRSSPLWRDLAEEIAESLARDGARVWAEWGSWGREVLASSKGALSRFIGVDGPRWMLYGVATGPADGADELVETLRDMIRSTVVTRGPDPLPVKTVLPLRLPEHLEERVEQAREQSARLSGGDVAGDAVVPVGPTGLAEEPEPAAGPFAEPFPAEPLPVTPPAAAAPVYPPPHAPARPVGAPPAPEHGAPARIGNPGQPTGPRRAPSVPSRPAAAHTGAYPAAAAPVRHPSLPPGSLHPSSPPGSLRPGTPPGSPHRSIGARPSGPADYPGGAYGGAARPVGAMGGDRRRGLPPVPTTAELDTNGFRRPGVEATWSLAMPVVSADQVAQQPAWALLSDAPAFWPHPTPPRGTRVPEPPDRGALDDAGGHPGGPAHPAPPYPPGYRTGSAGRRPEGPPAHPTGAGPWGPGAAGPSARYSAGQPSGPHRRPAAPDPASQHRPAGYPSGRYPSGEYSPGQPPARQYPPAYPSAQQPSAQQPPSHQQPPAQQPSGQYPPGHQPSAQQPGHQAPGQSYPAGQYPSSAARRPAGPPPHQPGLPHHAGQAGPPRQPGPAYPGAYRPAGPPPPGADQAPWQGRPERDGRPEHLGRPVPPADGSALLGTADSLHLALTQDSAVTGDRAALIDRSGRHRRPDQRR